MVVFAPFRPVALLASVLLSGCFVSKDLIDEAKDKDGDGSVIGDDCDDNDADVTGPVEWFADVDGDGFGSGELQAGCPGTRPSTNTADNADDCDDSNPSAYPGAEERYYDGIDQDCAGEDADGNGSVDDFDQDADGWEQDQDCDDTDPTLRPDPSLEEIHYDGIDNDCDLTTGDGDKDGDGFWSADYDTKSGGSSLTAPDGLTGDCYDDVDAPEQDVSAHNGFTGPAPDEVYPGAPVDAPYDGVDAACDGDAGEWDADGDGDASAAYPDRAGRSGTDCQDCLVACAGEPEWTDLVSSADINPAARETWYDGVDQDCAGLDSNEDGLNDDYDRDLDSFAAAGVTDDSGATGEDCLDTDPTTYPGAPDAWYDGVDSDCGGEDDYDADLDGYVSFEDFNQPTAGIDPWSPLPAGDCIDDPTLGGTASGQTAADYNPGVADAWYDGFDHDCAGDDDYDADADGHRSDAFATSSGLPTFQYQTPVVGPSAADADDCNDVDAAVSPSEAETASNGLDDNCDGAAAPHGIQGINEPAEHHSGAVVGKTFMYFGQSLATGDLDGDGVADLVVGSPYDSAGASYGGSARWYDGSDVYNSELTSSEYAGLFTGSGASSYAGQAVSIGDIDGDGIEDLIVAAYNTDNRLTGTGSSDGVAYVLRGPVSGSSTSPFIEDLEAEADATLVGTEGWELGRALVVADFDGDGADEVVLGAEEAEPYSWGLDPSGALYVFDVDSAGAITDSSADIIWGADFGDYLGSGDHSAAGDFDGDGIDDLLTGAPDSDQYHSSGGVAYVLEMPITSSGSTADDLDLVRFEPDDAFDRCGYSVAMGDIDDDGYADAVVGCYGWNSSRGLVAVVRGGATTTGTYSSGDADLAVYGDNSVTGEVLGYAVDVADITGDGLPDLMAGGPNYTSDSRNPYPGRAVMFDGSALPGGFVDANRADGVVLGDTSQGNLGISFDARSDIDGDGILDVFVGRYGTNLDGSSYGDVLLFTGGEW